MTPFATVMRRARKDPVARLIAAATSAGVRFRVSGATLQVAGTDVLDPSDQYVLRQYLPDIRARLEPPAPDTDLLDTFDIDVEYIADLGRARAVLDALGQGPFGFDIEMAGVGEPSWLSVTKSGRIAARQSNGADTSGLDPMRARVRLSQIYDPESRTAYVIDHTHVPVGVLAALERRSLVIHNSSFELAMLGAAGVHLRRTFCTLQMARLALGAERGGLKLSDLAKAFLGIELPKAEQVSDWSAERLSEQQIAYAAVDAAVAHQLVRPIWGTLDADTRNAFKLGNATTPAVVAMRLSGIPFDRAIHEATIAEWEHSYAEARAAFVAITGTEIPPPGAKRSAWLEERMPEDMLEHWPRTDTGLLRTKAEDLERLAGAPAVRPLLEVIHWDKRLRSFGRSLLCRAGLDGWLQMDLKPAATKTGRCSCTNPNLQQLPQDVRRAVVARDGRTLVVADYNQMELRVAAELSGDAALRRVYRDGQDMHTLNAEAFLGAGLETLPEEERDTARSKAKRIGFGTLYGSGPRGLMASVWSMYRIEMPVTEAREWRERFYASYPRLRAWQQETADKARVTGVLRSIAGRPLRAEWEPIQPLKWTLCCNYPVQSSAADVMLLAMARAHDALEGRDASLILQVHDELVAECAEPEADAVAALLEKHMVEAWDELFPDAPIGGLVDVSIRKCWAKEKKRWP